MTDEKFKKQITKFKTPAEVHFFVKCTQSDPAQRLALLLLREVRGSKAGLWQPETGGQCAGYSSFFQNLKMT